MCCHRVVTLTVSDQWSDAVTALTRRHLAETNVIGIPVNLKLRELIVITADVDIDTSTTQKMTESHVALPTREAFASTFIQLPSDSGGSKVTVFSSEEGFFKSLTFK